MENVSLGKVKKRKFLQNFSTKVTRSRRKVSLSKGKILFLAIFAVTFVFGSKEIHSQLLNLVSHFQVEAETTSYYKTSLNIDLAAVNLVSEKAEPTVLGISTQNQKIDGKPGILDKRAYVFDQYFLQNGSPLYGSGRFFVESCDRYGAPKDCIIAVAIARNESNLCKYYYSAEMHNCWGFGGGGIYRINFDSFEQSIDRVTQVLVQQYGIQYIINPSLMEETFCGDEPGCTNWGNKIKQFEKQIDDFSINSGFGSLLELRNN